MTILYQVTHFNIKENSISFHRTLIDFKLTVKFSMTKNYLRKIDWRHVSEINRYVFLGI